MSFKRKPPQGNVRRVKTNGQNIRGVLTNKRGRIVQYESFNEFKHILRLERAPEVLDYCSQPLIFSFVDGGGKDHTYVPDFKVWMKDGTIEIHEVTIEKRRAKQNLQIREQAGHDLCRKNGWKYMVFSEEQLLVGTELANLITLRGFQASAYYVEMVAVHAKNILAKGKLDVATLVTQISALILAPEWIVSGCIYHLLWKNDLAIVTNTLLLIDGHPNPKTAISLSVLEK